jgi:signal peptidase I
VAEGAFEASDFMELISAAASKDGLVFTSVGRSMEPFVLDGDKVRVRACRGGCSVGDVVLFQAGGGLVLHRVIGFQNSGGVAFLLAKGDNRLDPDPPVQVDAVLGKAVGVGDADYTRGFWRLINPLLGRLSSLQGGVYVGVASSAVYRRFGPRSRFVKESLASIFRALTNPVSVVVRLLRKK